MLYIKTPFHEFLSVCTHRFKFTSFQVRVDYQNVGEETVEDGTDTERRVLNVCTGLVAKSSLMGPPPKPPPSPLRPATPSEEINPYPCEAGPVKQPPPNGQDIPVKKPPTPTRQREQPLLQPPPPSYPQQLPAVPEEEPVCPQRKFPRMNSCCTAQHPTATHLPPAPRRYEQDRHD